MWVDSIQLPSSYTREEVNTREKIMHIVDSLTPRILKAVYSKLKKLLNESIICATKEYGPQDIIPATSLIPCTTPAKCVATLLRKTRSEVTKLQQEICLRESLSSMPLQDMPDLHALLQTLNSHPPKLLLDQFTDVIFDKIQMWREP
jgi:hypothetical protein